MDSYSENILSLVEEVQTEADSMAYQQLQAMKLANIQSVCDFNIFWVRDISPLVCTPCVIDFLWNNVSKFKRKLSIKEFLMADLLIKMYEPSNFEEFRVMFMNYKKTPDLFNNLVKKSA